MSQTHKQTNSYFINIDFYLKPYLKVIEGGSVFYAIIMSTSVRQTRNGSTALSGPMFNFSENPQLMGRGF